MREYLFRGKSEETKQWVYGSLVVRKAKDDIYLRNEDAYFITFKLPEEDAYRFERVIKNTVGQYVGLDANKNKIFEGDVVQYIYPQALIKHKYIVENFDGGVYPFDEELEVEDVQVLGNIHDNPELLQEVFNS